MLHCGALAQLGERLLCTQEVSGSIPLGSTKKWRISSVGRAPALQAGGHWFEPGILHHAGIAQLVEQLTCNQ